MPARAPLNLKNHTVDELIAELVAAQAPATAVRRLHASIFAHGASSIEEAARWPRLPARLRRIVRDRATLPALTVLERRRALDGFVKYLFESPLGGRFEAVRIPIFDEKFVICVSSQVGCALGCDFCETGRIGFTRSLETWEMIDQVVRVRAEADRPVRGVVFMGMGEPLLNYDATIRAARILTEPSGLAISGKAITLSTVGIVPAIRRYTRERHPYRLAFSITSAIPEKRRLVFPVERTHPLPQLVEAIREHAAARRERAMLAYVMIRGFNTGREDAEALRDAFAGIPIKLDLIDVNDPTGRYRPPPPDELSAFRDHLQILKSPISRRYSGGRQIGAACGTLAATQYGGRVLRRLHRRTPQPR